MRRDHTYWAWDVHCPSPQEVLRVEHAARPEVEPDRVLKVTRVSSESTEELSYRVGDYFTDITMLPRVGGDFGVLRIIFRRHPQAGRFWKDIMVRILTSIRELANDVSVTLAYRGDEPLDWMHLTATPTGR